jgi:hypothetical protein
MEYNVNNIIDEMDTIIRDRNKNKYTIKILLYALGVKESIENMKMTCKVDQTFVQLLEYLKPHNTHYIDIVFLKYLCLHQKKIIIKDETLATSTSSNSASSSQEDLNGAIQKMLVNDSIIINKIIENNNNIIQIKEIFMLLDANQNGYITALDIINSKKALDVPYMQNLIEELIKKPGGINFETFMALF